MLPQKVIFPILACVPCIAIAQFILFEPIKMCQALLIALAGILQDLLADEPLSLLLFLESGPTPAAHEGDAGGGGEDGETAAKRPPPNGQVRVKVRGFDRGLQVGVL